MTTVNGINGTGKLPPSWWSITKIRILAVTASAIGAVIIALMNITNTAEPYWFATRTFVRDLIVVQNQSTSTKLQELQHSQKQTALFLANSEARRIKAQINEKKGLLGDPTASPAIRFAIQQQIDDLALDLDRVKKEIDELTR